MIRSRILVATIAAVLVVTACASESPSSESTANGDTPPPVQPDTTEVDDPADTAPTTPSVSIAAATSLPTSPTVQLAQPAIWPASDVVFDTPEEAAESFVSEVLGVESVLGDFMGGDSRSGEIQVFSPGESGAEPTDRLERGLLDLRIIGPNDGWFVIGAVGPGMTIESPETLDLVPAGPLVVSGQGRGFEGTVTVTAYRAGDADDVLDQVITSGGVFETLEPYSVTLDLSDSAPGDVIALIVRGDTGLDGDPGDFASVPIVIDDTTPDTQ